MWASSLSLVALAATFLVSEVKCGVGGPEKDFHTFREVQVHLKDPQRQQAPIRLTEQGDGHHLGSLNLEIHDLEANPIFEVDLSLNRELIPQKYFQKYHKKVSLLYLDTFQTNQCAVLCTWHSKLHTSLLYHYLVLVKSCQSDYSPWGHFLSEVAFRFFI